MIPSSLGKPNNMYLANTKLYISPAFGSMVMFETDKDGLETVTPPTIGRPEAATIET